MYSGVGPYSVYARVYSVCTARVGPYSVYSRVALVLLYALRLYSTVYGCIAAVAVYSGSTAVQAVVALYTALYSGV